MNLAWLLVPLAYVVGMFPTAHLVGRLAGHDPTREGSGNPGASNVFRVAGARAGAAVLVGDVCKGFIPAGLGLIIDGRALGLAAGAAAVIGHVLPATRGFRGGKGVATMGGLSLMLYPFVGLGLLAVWAVVVKVFRKASIGSLLIVGLLPVGVALRGRPGWEILAVCALSALIVIRHWNNIKRIVTRKEHAIR